MMSRDLMRQQPTKPMILKNCAICRQIISMRKILIMAESCWHLFSVPICSDPVDFLHKSW